MPRIGSVFKACWWVNYVDIEMDKLDEESLHALKVAFCYMPKAIEVNEYDYAGRVEKILADINTVREVLLINDVDPDEVYGDLNPDDSPNSTY